MGDKESVCTKEFSIFFTFEEVKLSLSGACPGLVHSLLGLLVTHINCRGIIIAERKWLGCGLHAGMRTECGRVSSSCFDAGTRVLCKEETEQVKSIKRTKWKLICQDTLRCRC